MSTQEEASPATTATVRRSSRSGGLAKPKLSTRALELFYGDSIPDELRVGRLTLRVVHRKPNIFVIDDFLSERELDHIGSIIYGGLQANSFQKSFTQDGEAECVSADRTSTFLWLAKQQDSIIRKVEQRAADVVGLEVSHVEPLQLLSYRSGQSCALHHDAGTIIGGERKEDGSYELEPVPPIRLVTYFVALRSLEDPSVGHTEFPELNLSLAPVRGRAVLWPNVREDGSLEPLTVHKGCPIAKDSPHHKLAMNIWIAAQSMQGTALAAGTARSEMGTPSQGRKLLAPLPVETRCRTCHESPVGTPACKLEDGDAKTNATARADAPLVRCAECQHSWHRECMAKRLPADVPHAGRKWYCVTCAHCAVCESPEGASTMLMCDRCNQGFHIGCLQPPLTTVPSGAWFCPNCWHTCRVCKKEAVPSQADAGADLVDRASAVGKADADDALRRATVTCARCLRRWHAVCVPSGCDQSGNGMHPVHGTWQCRACRRLRDFLSWHPTDVGCDRAPPLLGQSPPVVTKVSKVKAKKEKRKKSRASNAEERTKRGRGKKSKGVSGRSNGKKRKAGTSPKPTAGTSASQPVSSMCDYVASLGPGTVVWAKFPRCPWSLGVLWSPDDEDLPDELQSKEGCVLVRWFPMEERLWNYVTIDCVRAPFEEHMDLVKKPKHVKEVLAYESERRQKQQEEADVFAVLEA